MLPQHVPFIINLPLPLSCPLPSLSCPSPFLPLPRPSSAHPYSFLPFPHSLPSCPSPPFPAPPLSCPSPAPLLPVPTPSYHSLILFLPAPPLPLSGPSLLLPTILSFPPFLLLPCLGSFLHSTKYTYLTMSFSCVSTVTNCPVSMTHEEGSLWLQNAMLPCTCLCQSRMRTAGWLK